MITEKDLQEAIAECEGQRNPNANTCMKLAAFYTIKNELYGKETDERLYPQQYSYSDSNSIEIEYDGNSEFSQIVHGMQVNDFMQVMDELMSALQVLNPRLYNGVIRKLNERK